MATEAANDILAEWETSLKSYRGHKKTGATALLPSSVQLYKLGLFLDAIAAVSKRDHAAIQRGYHEFLNALPLEYRENLLNDLNGAFWKVLQEQNEKDDRIAALRSVSQLLDGSPIAAQTCTAQWTIDNLSTLLDSYNEESTTSCIILLFQSYLLHSQADYEHLLPALHLLQQEAHVWNALVQHLNNHKRHWKETILQQFNDESQQEYLMSLLATSGHAEEAVLAQQLKQATRISSGGKKQQQQSAKTKHTHAASSLSTKEREIQRRIEQVQVILPDLGDGFVEAALAAHQGNVEATVAVLLEPESQWPAILRATDRSLPRRKPEFASTTMPQEEAEAKKIAKATLRAAERQQEQEAYLVDLVMRTGAGDEDGSHHVNDDNDEDEGDNNEGFVEVKPRHHHRRHDEYNDDYDDQYDDFGADLGGTTDSGLYDNYDAVRVYNAALKEVGAEQSFWEENRNTNRQTAGPKKKDKDFGPDKLKGGRVPGRGGHGGRGGGRGGGPPTAATDGKDDGEVGTKKKDGSGSSKPNLKQKQRKLDKRREQQKKAQVKRSGA